MKRTQFVIDLLVISTFVIIGALGYWLTKDPVSVLIPKHPMLSPQDWGENHSRYPAQITEARDWEVEREFIIRLQSDRDENFDRAEIVQTAVWYKDEREAAALWDQTYYSPGSDWDLFDEKFASRNTPASRLYCYTNPKSNSTTLCNYFAYRGHWFTQVNFQSDSEKFLPLSEVMQIILKVDQLLLAAADERLTESLPIQGGPTSPPYILNLSDPPPAIETPNPIITPEMFIPPTITPTGIPTVIVLPSCAEFQPGETRLVLERTLIFGNVLVEGLGEIPPAEPGESILMYFEVDATSSASSQARCYFSEEIYLKNIVQNELSNDCNTGCTSIRLVRVTKLGFVIENFK